MATIGSLVVNLVGNHKGLSAALNDARGQIDAFKTAGSLAIGAAVGAGGFKAFSLAADVEQTAMSFETLLGSAADAQKQMERMQAFALKTPFAFEDVAEAGKRILALGGNAESIIPMLKNVGDATAALGGGKDALDRVILALSQMQAKGKVSAQEMNQLAETGIAGWELLSKGMGKSVAEVMKLAENGVISSTSAIPLIMEQMNKRYGGGMERLLETTKGKFGELRDIVGDIMLSVGNEFLPLAKYTLEWKEELLPLITAVAAFTAALVAAAVAARAYTAAKAMALALSGPAGWVALATAAGLAGGAYYGVAKALQEIERKTKDADKALANLKKNGLNQPRLLVDVKSAAQKDASAAASRMDAGRENSIQKMLSANQSIRQAIADANDELAVMQGRVTETQLKIRDFAKPIPEQVGAIKLLTDALNAIDREKSAIKAKEDAERLVNDQRERGLSIIEQYASPAEQAIKKAQELQALLAAGFIDQKTFDRANAEINGQKSTQQPQQGTAALAANTKEAFSAFLTFQRGGTKDPILDEAKTGNKIAQQQKTVLDKIEQKLTGTPIPVKL